ncbi:uncharacterized protein LOC124290842 [Haliotis rubra]|uniref:uncharacterized protein LOC124290842 n=1 Tax=Haliotis rubra TaxID=36100 RepID=UPI001EE57A20|nr:uncharacterized protein LOC124290842 [Haliotis rubra]
MTLRASVFFILGEISTMKTFAVAVCLVLLVAMASATYRQYGGGYGGYGSAYYPRYGYGGNDAWNNQDFNQYANINQQQSNKQKVDQDYYRRGGHGFFYPGGKGHW